MRIAVAGLVLLAVAARPVPRSEHWIGTWAAAPQRALAVDTFRGQTVRLIVHLSAGGRRLRVRVSNVFGDRPVAIGSAHLARRAAGADVDARSDRVVTFDGHGQVTIAPRSQLVSDPIDFSLPALSDVAVSLFFPEAAEASTAHMLALQTNYVAEGDATSAAKFPVARTIVTWPFLTGIDIEASARGTSIVAFGSSTTDGDGSTQDANRRWPDVLAQRLQKAGVREVGILNEGIIGNRLLSDFDSPGQKDGPFATTFERLGPSLGEAGLKRFERDVLRQSGVRYVILLLGINDILFPGAFTPASQHVTADALIAGNRELVARAHKNGICAVGTTIPPIEGALFRNPPMSLFSPEAEAARQAVNAWIRAGGGFDTVIDLDTAVRDPDHPARLRPSFDAGDHLHVNDAGNIAQGNAFPLAMFNGCRVPAAALRPDGGTSSRR